MYSISPVGGAQLGGDLEPLRLAARQRRGRLAEPEIAEPDHDVCSRRAGRSGGEEVDGLVDGHLEDVADVAPAQLHAEDFGPVAPPFALLARRVHILEEVHLELLEAVA